MDNSVVIGTNTKITRELFDGIKENFTYSDRMEEKMFRVITEYSREHKIGDLELYQYAFFGDNDTRTLMDKATWKKVCFSASMILNAILSNFLKIYTVDIYGSKIFQFNNNDLHACRTMVARFFDEVNESSLTPYRCASVNKFIKDFVRESMNGGYIKFPVWKAFELSLLYSIYRHTNDESKITNVEKKETEDKPKEIDILETLNDDEKELVDNLFKSPVINKLFKGHSEEMYKKFVDEFIRISIIWARR